MKRVLMVVDGSHSADTLTEFVQNHFVPGRDQIVILLIQEIIPVEISRVLGGKATNKLLYSYYDLLEKVLKAIPEYGEERIARLLNLCKIFRMKVHLVFERDSLLEVLEAESLYADLALIGSWQITNKAPHHAIERSIHCAIVMVPQYHLKLKNIIIIYDHHPFSMDAIKQFNYLLADKFQNSSVTLVVNLPQELSGNEETHIMEYVRVHIPYVGLLRFSPDEKEKLNNFLEQNPEALIVSIRGTDKSDILSNQTLEITSPLFIAERIQREVV